MNRRMWFVNTVVLGTTLLVGCAPAAKTATAPTSANHATANASSANQTGSTNQTKSSVSVGNSTANNTVSEGNTSQSTSSTGKTKDGTKPPSALALVKQSMTLAKKGKAIDVPFAVKQNLSDVQKVWGKPDSQNAAGAGIYATYTSRKAAFGFNKGEQIFDVRSYSSQLKTITPSDVESALGRPGDTRHTSDSVIYMYPAGIDYQLLFVFPKTSAGNVKTALNHVSVFWPRGTVDIMAATQPAPSVVIDNKPGSVGSLFTFSIQNPPKGYRLVELEWIPSQGAPVVNTFQQAMANGSSGATNRGFSISGDGQTYGFIYPASDRGQSGIVRVIFQDTSGRAMIGKSSSITLK